MAPIDTQDFINELRFDIKTKDMIKARIVLSHIEEVDDKTQNMALFELSRAEDAFAIPVIAEILTAHPDLSDKFPILKETLFARALDSSDVFLSLLNRELRPENRALLVEVAGEIRSEDATPVLMGIINDSNDEKVLHAAILALGMIGDPKATTAISEYLYSGHAELIIVAIQALGNLESPTAIQRLWEKLGDEPDFDLMILDAFAQSQAPEALDKLNESLSSHHAHIRTAAKKLLAKIGPKAVPGLIKNLLHNDPDLSIHSLNVLGDIGDESAVKAIRKLLHNEPKDANVRFAAYETLGRLPASKGAITLAAGLHDPVDNVRSAAACAIDKNYNTVLAAGIKNMIHDEGDASRQIIHTILNAQCNNLFLDLIDVETFKPEAVAYLNKKAHEDIRNHFTRLLTDNEREDLLMEIGSEEKSEESTVLKVFAVDDSKMILNIYRSVLHNLGCQSKLYEFPVEAIKEVRDEKPDVILTDLNMPDISGIDVAKGVRKWFSKEQLPVIMVTTQNAAHDNEAAYEAGVNAIIQKPFDEEVIKQILNEHVKGFNA